MDFDKPKVYGDTFISDGLVMHILVPLVKVPNPIALGSGEPVNCPLRLSSYSFLPFLDVSCSIYASPEMAHSFVKFEENEE